MADLRSDGLTANVSVRCRRGNYAGDSRVGKRYDTCVRAVAGGRHGRSSIVRIDGSGPGISRWSYSLNNRDRRLPRNGLCPGNSGILRRTRRGGSKSHADIKRRCGQESSHIHRMLTECCLSPSMPHLVGAKAELYRHPNAFQSTHLRHVGRSASLWICADAGRCIRSRNIGDCSLRLVRWADCDPSCLFSFGDAYTCSVDTNGA